MAAEWRAKGPWGPCPYAEAVAEMDRRYGTYRAAAKPVAGAWARTLMEYARVQAKEDLGTAYEMRRERNPRLWTACVADLEEVKRRPELAEVLGRHGMDVALLMFTKVGGGGDD